MTDDKAKYRPKNPSNRIMKAKEAAKEAGRQDLIPPCIASGSIRGPTKRIRTMGDIQKEQDRLYGLVFAGELHIGDFTKLMYGLGQMSHVLKSKAEMDALEDAYIKQWQGVKIIAPPGAEPDDAMQQAIEGEIVDG